MSTTVLNDQLDLAGVDTDLTPLEFATNDAPQFVSAIVDAVVNAFSGSSTSGSGISAYNGGVATYRVAKADLSGLKGEGTSIEQLVALRDRAVAA